MLECRQLGFVLMSVLVLMSLFSLIGIHALNISLNAIKTTEHLWQHRQALYAAEQALLAIEKQPIAHHSDCLVPWLAAADIARKPLTWWRHRCSGNLAGIRYYYCLELLAKEPCVKGKNVDKSLFSAEFYRISLLACPHIKGAKIILQSVVINAQHQNNICTGQPRVVRVGRQVWRTL